MTRITDILTSNLSTTIRTGYKQRFPLLEFKEDLTLNKGVGQTE